MLIARTVGAGFVRNRSAASRAACSDSKRISEAPVFSSTRTQCPLTKLGVWERRGMPSSRNYSRA